MTDHVITDPLITNGQEEHYTKYVFNKNTGYSFKEALVHKVCNISPLFPKTFDVKIEGMNLTIEMEQLKDTLKDPTKKVESWLRILQAVALLNHFGICHRDIKSENVLYRETPGGEEAVLIDFGLSKVLIGESHTPDVISEFYRPPELDDTVSAQKYGVEIDSWALAIWALELFNKKFNPKNFLEQWEMNKYSHYVGRVPEKIRHIVDSFLKPAGERKVALDWVEIDKDKKLFYYPPDYECHVPEKVLEWKEGYKAIRWNIEGFSKEGKDLTMSDSEKAVIAVWMTSMLFMPWPINLHSLCKPFNLDEVKIYNVALSWFMNFKLS